ncbi:MAG: methyltransferase, CheR-type [Verrucomicrobiales bacterium]|nr:methyltransferase, CheR-type [Verrucomicrobiales bacterium]
MIGTPELNEDKHELAYIIDLVYEKSRVRLHEGKEQLIRARLGKRIRLYGFNSLREYIHFLKSTPEELTHVVDSLTTNYTHFLREKDHFEFLASAAANHQANNSKSSFKVWSAACATGEEPYSMSFYLSDNSLASRVSNWSILATDISTKALETARRGIYPSDKIGMVPQEWLPKFFQKGSRDWEGWFRVKESIRQRIQFKQLNLLGFYPFSDLFEVIFCRNVMIYFDRETQKQLIDKLAATLSPGGLLFIGHSESLNGIQGPLNCVSPSIYQRPS